MTSAKKTSLVPWFIGTYFPNADVNPMEGIPRFTDLTTWFKMAPMLTDKTAMSSNIFNIFLCIMPGVHPATY